MTSIIFVLILTSLIIENSNKSNLFSTVKQSNNESDFNKITNYSVYKRSVKVNNKRFKEIVDYWKISLLNQNLNTILQTRLNKSINKKFKSDLNFPEKINKNFKEIVDYWEIKNYEIFPFLSNKYF